MNIKIKLPSILRGRSIHENVIPTVCNLKNMLDKLKEVDGNYSQLKQWEKRSFRAYRIDEIKNKLLDAPSEERKQIIREHILKGDPKDFGPSCIDIYLVAYITENFGTGKNVFFKYIKDKGISDKENSAQAIWQVGKGDGEYLEVLNRDGTVRDWTFFSRWVGQKCMRVFIDRLEENFAVIHIEDDPAELIVPKRLLPEWSKEGSWLEINITLGPEGTTKQKK